jgi:hypothetical protein
MQLVEMIHECGLPNGVLNVVHGGKPTGKINEKYSQKIEKNKILSCQFLFFFVYESISFVQIKIFEQ